MKGAGEKRGFALMVVILVILLLSFLASELLIRIRFESRVAFNRQRHEQARFLAEAGVNLALFRVLDKAQDDTLGDPSAPFLYGREYEAVLPAGKIRYYAVSETGKIGLNSANLVPLKLYLAWLGLDDERVSVIVDSLLDWRDADNLHHLNGAEKDYYQGLADPYIPRNGPLMDPGEFLLVRGTEGLGEMIDPGEVFTVHNPSGKINVNSLSPALTRFIAEGDEDKEKLYRDTRKGTGLINDALLAQVLGVDRFNLLRSNITYFAGGNSYYSLVGYGEPAGDEGAKSPARSVGVRLLVKKGGRDGYANISWQETKVNEKRP